MDKLQEKCFGVWFFFFFFTVMTADIQTIVVKERQPTWKVKVQMKWTLQNVCAVQTGDVTWCEWGGTSMTRSRRPPLMNLRALARLTQAWLPCSRLQPLQSKHATSCCSFDNVDVTLCLFHLHMCMFGHVGLYVAVQFLSLLLLPLKTTVSVEVRSFGGQSLYLLYRYLAGLYHRTQ